MATYGHILLFAHVWVAAVRLCLNNAFLLSMNLVHVSSLALHQFITTISFFEDCGNYAFCSVFNALIGMLNQGSYRSFHILLCPIYVLLLCMCYAMLAGLGVMIHCILFMCTALLVPFIASHTLHNNILLLIYQA